MKARVADFPYPEHAYWACERDASRRDSVPMSSSGMVVLRLIDLKGATLPRD